MTYLLYVNLTWQLIRGAVIAMLALATLAPPAQAAPATDPVIEVLAAGGQRQWISCEGTGAPTVVISSGLGADSRMWSKVLPKLRDMTRTCSYDRPGLGNSPARIGPKTTDAGEHAEELRALLTAAGEPGPFILVGHSYAGMILRAFANKHLDDVAGVLLLDAVYPGIHKNFLPSYRSPWHEGGTSIDMSASAAATGAGPHLGATPLVVLTAGEPGNGTSWADRRWHAEQVKAARLSTNSLHLIAENAGHIVQRDQPRIVINAVRKLLAAARTGDPLT